MSRVPPRTVEELIKRMNTLGGQCYLEHATMIREFFSRIERVRFLVRGVTLRQTAAAQLRALIIKVQKTLEEDTP